MNNYIEFTPTYSPKFQAKHLDSLHFQWSGIDENGEWIMYNNSAGVIEEGNEMYIEWNGTRYPAYHFLYCDHLDGNISMDSVRVYRVVDGKNTKITS